MPRIATPYRVCRSLIFWKHTVSPGCAEKLEAATTMIPRSLLLVHEGLQFQVCTAITARLAF